MKSILIGLFVVMGLLIQGCSPSLNSYRIKFEAPKHKKAAGAEAPESRKKPANAIVSAEEPVQLEGERPATDSKTLEKTGFFAFVWMILAGILTTIPFLVWDYFWILGIAVPFYGFAIALSIISLRKYKANPEKYYGMIIPAIALALSFTPFLVGLFALLGLLLLALV